MIPCHDDDYTLMRRTLEIIAAVAAATDRVWRDQYRCLDPGLNAECNGSKRRRLPSLRRVSRCAARRSTDDVRRSFSVERFGAFAGARFVRSRARRAAALRGRRPHRRALCKDPMSGTLVFGGLAISTAAAAAPRR
jgi:hypothetical protein